jgi:hypothetical protein
MKHLINLLFISATMFAIYQALPTIEMARKTKMSRIESSEITHTQNVPTKAEEPATEPQNKPEQIAVKTEPIAPPRTACEYIKDYDWDVRVMTAIAMAESSCRPGAKGDGHLTYTHTGRTYGYSLGILQVRILPGREHCDTLDPSVNVACAYRIYKGQGLSAWSVYNNGKYLRFL